MSFYRRYSLKMPVSELAFCNAYITARKNIRSNSTIQIVRSGIGRLPIRRRNNGKCIWLCSCQYQGSERRQAEGIAAAKMRGVRFGRPPSPLPENFHEIYQQWKNGKITGLAAAKACGMPMSTFRYRAEIYEKAKLL